MNEHVSPVLGFREASVDDSAAIAAIHNINVRQSCSSDSSNQNSQAQGNEAQGFLLAEMTETEVRKKLGTSSRFFLAVSHTLNPIDSSQDNVNVEHDLNREKSIPTIPVGYVSITTPTLTPETLQSIRWVSDFDPTRLMSDRHLYIQTVAVYPQWAGRGIGRFIYQSIYETFPTHCLSLFVATKPLCNERSLQFHRRQGFRVVGILRNPQLLDLKHYESVIFFREAQAVLDQSTDSSKGTQTNRGETRMDSPL